MVESDSRHISKYVNISGGVLKWCSIPKSSIFHGIFPSKPSSYWGTPIVGTPHISKWYGSQLFDPQVMKLPAPKVAQRYRVENLYDGPMDARPHEWWGNDLIGQNRNFSKNILVFFGPSQKANQKSHQKPHQLRKTIMVFWVRSQCRGRWSSHGHQKLWPTWPIDDVCVEDGACSRQVPRWSATHAQVVLLLGVQ